MAIRPSLLCCLVSLLILASVPPDSLAADRHGGIYYPPNHTSEDYLARTAKIPEIGRKDRIAFATDFMSRLMAKTYFPKFVMFVKGEKAEKMIITALEDDSLNTIYRMRALLALLTVRARETELFRTMDVADVFTFFEMLKLLGIERLTVTDGKTFAHQINIK